MSHLLLVLCGAAVVVLVFLDALAMTLHVGSGAGPVTGRLAGRVWRGLIRLHRRDSRSTVLSSAGAFLIVAVVLAWVALLWLGWTLLLLGSGGPIVHATSREPANVWEVAYFAGVTIFTLGTGDIVASTTPSRVLTSIASFSGLSLITLAITYLLSVVSAVVARRTVAARVHDLGKTAEEIVQGGWTGQDFSSAFVQQLVALTEQVGGMAEQHLAYPALHYFHGREPEASAPLAVAKLDDALLILSAGVAPASRPHRSAVEPLRQAIGRYLATARAMSQASDEGGPPPPAPRLEVVRDAGIPVVLEEFRRRVDAETQRRRSLRRLVHSDGWSWPQP